ncbi:probable G-protein coupled receptor 139 [Hypanus sabinus]|uniref:probable G-protein coupled receptor 139 n=1 Tax=Hypanus sabinus TaxID=79690 RepID=UPI0028C3CCEB|nr:probable G-protein coupled receptor 139 [Hypanus sabinus]XP_059813920.1 probable G-protein coupled receptor 139 [Hypanus sabinus]XP_059814099.1 probable G-protein coupled receptor 139 [Hypanus sabinus]
MQNWEAQMEFNTDKEVHFCRSNLNKEYNINGSHFVKCLKSEFQSMRSLRTQMRRDRNKASAASTCHSERSPVAQTDYWADTMSSIVHRYLSVQKILFVLIAVIGVPVNLLAIVILSRGKCGLSTCTTRYLVAMAAADLLSVFTEIIFLKSVGITLPVEFSGHHPCVQSYRVLRFTATQCSVWFTVTFTVDRFVAICCQKLKTKYCTGKTAAVVLTTTGVLTCLRNVPRYFTREPKVIIDNAV